MLDSFFGLRCPDCQGKIAEDDRICPHCGVALEAPITEEESPSEKSKAVESPPTKTVPLPSEQTKPTEQTTRIFCPQCGQQLSDEVRFCWKCGTDIRKAMANARSDEHQVAVPTGVSSSAAMVTSEAARVRCSVCNQNDRIAKVSAIVAGQTHHITGVTQEWVSEKDGGHWSSVPYSGTQMSDLAKNLTPPKKPSANRYNAYHVVMFLVEIPFAIMIIAALMFRFRNFGIMAVTFAIALVFAYAGDIEYKKQLAHVKANTPIWEQAMTKWNRLYYCARDDIIFDPSDDTHAAVNNFTAYLHS